MSSSSSSSSYQMNMNENDNENKNVYVNNIFTKSLISQRVEIDIKNIGTNLVEVIKEYIVREIEGKCINEGYVKRGSVKVQYYTSGELFSSKVLFDVVVECYICYPVEDMLIECVAINITKAGIRSELKMNDGDKSPLVIFLAREHNDSDEFDEIKENDKILVNVIGSRFEINDKYISVIAELKNKIK